MQDVVVGLLAVLVGALLCFRGWVVMRVVIPLWGAFAGFMFGAGLASSLWDGGFLATALGWVMALLFAVVFGLLAYLYYEVAVVLTMAGIGFAIATAVLVAMGVTWSWLIILAGLALAVVLAIIAIAGNLPTVLLVLFTAFAGSATAVAGLMLVFGVVDIAAWSVATTREVRDDWWWYAVYLVVGFTGMVLQLRSLGRWSESLRQTWVESGGKELAG